MKTIAVRSDTWYTIYYAVGSSIDPNNFYV